ncbi:inositol monophosphatase family protein [Cellulomonas fengjieae]|uniref:inositol monophosphatase family protein n=1 Tax=Cellulomonas fengjieae TaxID=2819978 RepID=UPI001AAFF864|nr:inositol monophosphatase family protein [Cellulomonas fengjieae]MBO3103581.1 inositol monophosphatase [Cellulomonas fengjieae]
MNPLSPDQVRELVETARTLAQEAGELVREGRRRHVGVAATKSSAQDVVTAMDLASEALLRRRLAELRPDDAILGEEEAFRPGTSGITWVVDPIDGTVNYLYGISAYAVSVAAVVGPDPTSAPDPATWTAVAGCVFAPEDGRTFTAGLGLGASLDGVRLHANEPRPLIDSLVGTGFGYVATRRRVQGRIVAELLPRVRDIRRVGSAALDLCAVAAGTLDLYYERGLQPWDLAAGALIAQEAGAQVTGLRGGPAQESMTVAGPAGRIEELRSLLESLDADSDG